MYYPYYPLVVVVVPLIPCVLPLPGGWGEVRVEKVQGKKMQGENGGEILKMEGGEGAHLGRPYTSP